MTAIMTETARRWDALAGEWRTITVETAPEPRQPARRTARQPARPRDLSGLSASSPLPAWWRDTAYAPADGLADLRTYVKPATTRTHRPAVVMPADPGSITVTR